jgi:hypothetical protein
MAVEVAALIEYFNTVQGKIIQQVISGATVSRNNALLLSVNKQLATLQNKSVAWVEQNIPTAYKEGMNAVNAEYAKQYTAAGKDVPFKYPGEFATMNKKAIGILVENAQADFDSAIGFVGRKVKDDIRRAGVQAIADKVSLGTTVKKTRDILAKQYAEQGLSAIKYKRNGKDCFMRLETYAETVARSTTREATNTATVTQVQEIGNDLVKMTSHSSSCPICMPLEGRVYSISGKSTEYPPLDKAYSGEYANIHPNCGHRLLPYIPELQDDGVLAKDKEFSNRSFDIDKWPKGQKERAQSQLASYQHGQDKKRSLYIDRRQYEKYKAALPNDAPKSLSAFRSIKKADGDKWSDLQSDFSKAAKITAKPVISAPAVKAPVAIKSKVTAIKAPVVKAPVTPKPVAKVAPVKTAKEYQSLTAKDAERLRKVQNKTVSESNIKQIEKSRERYVGDSNSYEINKGLRSGEWNKGRQAMYKPTIKALDNSMIPLTTNIKTVRYVDDSYLKALGANKNMSIDQLKKQLVGKGLSDKAYMSTSYDSGANVFKNKEIIMNVNAKAGSKAYITGNMEESEIIFARDTKYIISNVTQKGKKTFIDVLVE